MFESNMLENMQEMRTEPPFVNPWRSLVSVQFKEFLDSISTSKNVVNVESEDE
jgi:hypothetical protein